MHQCFPILWFNLILNICNKTSYFPKLIYLKYIKTKQHHNYNFVNSSTDLGNFMTVSLFSAKKSLPPVTLSDSFGTSFCTEAQIHQVE